MYQGRKGGKVGGGSCRVIWVYGAVARSWFRGITVGVVVSKIFCGLTRWVSLLIVLDEKS